MEIFPIAAALVAVLYGPGWQTVDQKDGGEASLVAREGDQGLGTVVSLDPDIDASKLVTEHQEGGLLLHQREGDCDPLVL